MPRSNVITIQDMYRRRATNWEHHYKNRGLAKSFATEDQERISRAISQRVPYPKMLADGSLLDGMEELRGTAYALEYTSLRLDRSMMCIWYWSESAWMELVREFQSLPDVDEDHYLFYDDKLDATIIMRISTKGTNRQNKYKSGKKIQVQLGGNSGGTTRLVPEILRSRAGSG